MATPDRNTYSTDGTSRAVYSRESNSTAWFVGIIVALALLAIGYLVFSANSGPTTESTTINNTPAVEAPAVVEPEVAPMTEAPPAIDAAPAETAPATEAPPATEPPPATETPATEPAPGA